MKRNSLLIPMIILCCGVLIGLGAAFSSIDILSTRHDLDQEQAAKALQKIDKRFDTEHIGFNDRINGLIEYYQTYEHVTGKELTEIQEKLRVLEQQQVMQKKSIQRLGNCWGCR